MTALLGGVIFAFLLCLPGMALLWPVFAAMRRRRPAARFVLWYYAAATLGSGLLLWFLIPLAVWWFLQRPTH